MKGIIAKKIGMTQVYDDKGVLTPVTVLQAGPCTVIQVRTGEKNGYSAIQLGFGTAKAKNKSKAVKGHCKAAKLDETPPRSIIEVRLDTTGEIKTGDVVKADIFSADEYVDVTGTSKGKGFQGVVKRWNFAGGRASHGGAWTRKPGSIGCKEKPGNIIKGKKMPGQLGNERVTIQNLRVVKVSAEDNILFVKGAVPGANGTCLIVKSAVKRKKSEAVK